MVISGEGVGWILNERGRRQRRRNPGRYPDQDSFGTRCQYNSSEKKDCD